MDQQDLQNHFAAVHCCRGPRIVWNREAQVRCANELSLFSAPLPRLAWLQTRASKQLQQQAIDEIEEDSLDRFKQAKKKIFFFAITLVRKAAISRTF